uniref:acylphosphatase n=1 Tax=Fibrocapsa japonica TaxID=94617 RepID=A0A6U1NP13_9STRA|mmetsp:Transcript_21927/g.31839  ORF Transcript_21927/g.31839 Transcript_21927/m.31839 type:complete len:192 (+) Transcript_21927:27-602(+)|eukprot:CAMPEP_0113934684 /NCGR_PEP_ID=MMETSP1339-20121228/1964_1 /TAXON_ID=94617 /ORGANISM="Fibrocapsa japonica" /LENGTH=191 /DNA_ID=CAMNT_0000936575 /DNA_START=26 /DNA_END=601 /DNA_ORIENTATION=+ /assembly_acc=CAM_ASM_000762
MAFFHFFQLFFLTCIIFGKFRTSYSQPEGWRMVDRFYGFRFEVSGTVQDVGFRKSTQDAAEVLGCFGWVQNTDHGTVVGEGRCSKWNGPLLVGWLRAGPTAAAEAAAASEDENIAGSLVALANQLPRQAVGSLVTSVEVKEYEDTKIKLHFSHFKILPDTRVTCFRDPPHQCAEFASNAPGHETATTHHEL